MDTVLKRWGIAWILVGAVSAWMGCINSTREGLLLITLAFLAFSACAVLYASKQWQRAVGQLVLGFLLLVVSTGIFIFYSVPSMGAVPLWLGFVAGSANRLAGQRLSALALLGQIAPIGLITFTNVTRQGLSVRLALLCLFLACCSCLIGSILARRSGTSIRSQAKVAQL